MIDTPIYTVSQVNQAAKSLLENTFHIVRLVGEISNLVTASSGHIYFSLKDHSAQIKCAFFCSANQRLRGKLDLQNGQEIIVQARVTLYEPRGDFQLVIQSIESSTEGALQRAFLVLKNKLEAEGLFASHIKQPIPRNAQTVGVITSPTGAALQDILHVLKRRCPAIRVIVYPSLVQGTEAAAQIVRAIQTANRRDECNVLILARGGGSLEDLWPFNEEIVARAIFHSQLPIISGVGHEIDFTIADFVADYRAPTPSAAAECVSPDTREWQTQWQYFLQKLTTLMQHTLQREQQTLDSLQKRLRHPRDTLRQQREHLSQFQLRLTQSLSQYLRTHRTHLDALARQLHAISPLRTLDRGYAIIKDSNNHVLFDSQHIQLHDPIQVIMASAHLTCRVEKIENSSLK